MSAIIANPRRFYDRTGDEIMLLEGERIVIRSYFGFPTGTVRKDLPSGSITITASPPSAIVSIRYHRPHPSQIPINRSGIPVSG